MTVSQKERLKEYLQMLHMISAAETGEPAIGMIVYEPNQYADIVETLDRLNVARIESSPAHPDRVIEELLDVMENGRIAVIDVKENLDPKIADQIRSIATGMTRVQLAGEEQPRILNPVPKGAGVALLGTASVAERLSFQEIVSSTCSFLP